MTELNVQIKNKNGDLLYPKTKAAVVFNNSNESLGTVESGAEVNIIEEVQVNGVALTPDGNRSVNVVIPETQVNSDWNAVSGVAQILNKPTLGTMAAETASDYTKTSGLATVAMSGAYSDLSGTPTVDQTYSSGSTNAQSGTAVASAVSTKQDSSTAVTHTKNTSVGSTTQPVYIASNGTATAIDYKFWVGTQTEYDNIQTKDSSTIYFIKAS